MLGIPMHLANTLERFKRAQHNGVSGVMQVRSHTAGPIIGITACTHGNEPSGLAVFEHLLASVELHRQLLRGTVFLVVNNIEATEKYFAATSKDEVREARYSGVNMNRLPEDTLKFPKSLTYEIRRANELYPIWQQFNVGFDVHSTTEPTLPMIINRGKDLPRDLIRGFPITTLISNIDQIQWRVPAFAFYGGLGNPTRALAIEAGQHEDPEAFTRAITCTTALLQNLGMLPGHPATTTPYYDEYIVRDKITFPDYSYDFVRPFENFESLERGTVLAKSAETGREIRVPFEGHILFPSQQRGKDKDLNEEAAFYALPKQTLRIAV